MKVQRCAGPTCDRPPAKGKLCHGHLAQRRRHPGRPLLPIRQQQTPEQRRAAQRERNINYYARNRELLLRRERERQVRNRASILAAKKRHRRGAGRDVDAKYRRAHAAERSAYNQRWSEAHPDSVRAASKRQSVGLTDAFVANSLGLPVAAIPGVLIEAKRAHLKLKRLIKEKSK